MGIREPNSHIRKSSDVRRVDRRFPIKAFWTRIQIIDSDEEHVGPGFAFPTSDKYQKY